MSAQHPDVDAFLARAPRWRQEMEALRAILLETDLTEAFKWGKPCYTAEGKNVVILQPFKPHLALMFFKGALLDDPEGVLRSQGENSRAAMRMEFTSPEEVAALAATVRAYVEEAIAVEEAGLTVPKEEAADEEVPAELARRFREDAAYREAFEALTPGRRRSYLMHFAGAKRSETRERRIEKSRAKVLAGKGFNER